MIKVIVDDKIPYIREALAAMDVEACYVPGDAFTPAIVSDADALIIRTRTRCDEALLEGSRVQFIATATIGYDHIDTVYCAARGIRWTNAPGCNAASVRQYVQSVLLLLQRERGLQLADATLGVVGVGHVGSLVVEMARSWGMRVLCCDPPRAERGEQGFVSLETIAREADVITLHTITTSLGSQQTSVFISKTYRCPIILELQYIFYLFITQFTTHTSIKVGYLLPRIRIIQRIHTRTVNHRCKITCYLTTYTSCRRCRVIIFGILSL